MVASDKLFFWLFQERCQRLQPLARQLLPDMEGYTFTAPVIKEREVRLDGLFLPPPDQIPAKPAIILEAQMAPPNRNSCCGSTTKAACCCAINTARANPCAIGGCW